MNTTAPNVEVIYIKQLTNRMEQIFKYEHQRCVSELRKKIEEYTGKMIAMVKMDRSQLRLEF